MTDDIVTRLRGWHWLHLSRIGELFDEAAGEIKRLRGDAEIARLRLEAAHGEVALLREAIHRLAQQDATLSVSGGNVTVTMDATLNDEEREAIWTVAEAYAENDGDPDCERIARIMQGLWQRTK
jgi:hypothetical protein